MSVTDECGMVSDECRVVSDECRVVSDECGMVSAEWFLMSAEWFLTEWFNDAVVIHEQRRWMNCSQPVCRDEWAVRIGE